MHQSLQGATFHVEHILPLSRGGTDDLNNLALCCPSCNLHKSDRTEAEDPDSDISIPLFNPRCDHWEEHFRWEDYHSVGRTPVGRATITALDFNHPRRVLIRHAEELLELFPPTDLHEPEA
jgi:hypothetical protein